MVRQAHHLSKAYNPASVEDAIYKRWEESGAFRPESCDPKGEPFTISMPPPNATGQLHLGHAVMLALEDIFIRFARMQGKKALWVPGTDHAAIATENVVIKQLKDKGMKDPRKELGREKLIAAIAEFVEESKATIRSQVRKMGSSCDWSRERYTFEPALNRCVNEVFRRMYEDGLIYRGHRIVNWDPKLQTTVSDDEVEYKEEKSAFYTFQYGPFQIATARPETKFGDKYVVMHPEDKRYAKYKHGETFEAEWINGPVRATVIKDSSIDPEFGTGVMTITPWHDHTDFAIAERHGLEKEQIIGFDGKLLAVAGEFSGIKIDEARPLIVEKLKSKGLLVNVEGNYVHNKAISQRGGGSIEPQIKLQWFIDVNKEVVPWKEEILSLKQIMHSVVHHGDIAIIPDRFGKTYFHWIDNLRDWCISRQIWWGHRVPVWYDKQGKMYLRKQQRFILARHGQSTGNKAKIIQGQDDALTADGTKQAEKLANMLDGKKITKIVSSRSARALETAEIVAKKFRIEVEIWDELNAIDYGTLVGLPDAPDKLAIERAVEEKTGETIEQFLSRAEAVWERMQQQQSDGDILVVSHRTNFSALETIRKGGDKKHLIEERRSNEKADFGLWGEIVVPDETEGQTLEQDPDTLDTWFSSALWTWSTLIDPAKAADASLSLEEILKQSPDFKMFHPTSVMETGYDILFFWVARMILMTTYATGQIPFKTVYLHGLIRTRDGKKMSKSHPETMIDPLDIIPKYGADALRLSMIVGQSPGADSRLYEEKIAGYRNFVNKLWNASRFVLMQCEEAKIDPKTITKLPETAELSLADRAMLSRLQAITKQVTEGLAEHRLSEAGDTLYSFVWDDFCDWYIELTKENAPPSPSAVIPDQERLRRAGNITVLVHTLRNILQLLHPYCPFVTEELWSQVKPEDAGMLIAKSWPEFRKEFVDVKAEEAFMQLISVIQAVRKIRAQQGIEPGREIAAIIHGRKWMELLESQEAHIRRLGKIESLTFDTDPKPHKNAASVFLPEIEVHVPLEGLMDVEAERKKLLKEQEDITRFMKGIEAKLQNADFTAKAPEQVIAAERKKLAVQSEKKRKIEERLKILGER